MRTPTAERTKKSLNARIPSELHRAVKATAAALGWSVEHVVTYALTHFVNEEAPPAMRRLAQLKRGGHHGRKGRTL